MSKPKSEITNHKKIAAVDTHIEELTLEITEMLQSLVSFMMLKRDLTYQNAGRILSAALTPEIQERFSNVLPTSATAPKPHNTMMKTLLRHTKDSEMKTDNE